MSHLASQAPAHRNVSNIRPVPAVTTPSSPHTPLRNPSSTFGSPSSLRAEEDCVILEIGARSLRVGFAGDSVPKAVIGFGVNEQRRAGDYRQWEVEHTTARIGYVGQESWGEREELWRPELRGLDLGLVGDKIERALRDAYAKHLLIDSRPRRILLALPPQCPLPLLLIVLDTLFNNFQPPNISLMSAPVLCTIAAGLRSALVVDIGWAETVVTSVYEYREIQCRRSIRGSKRIGEQFFKTIARHLVESTVEEPQNNSVKALPSFQECEEIIKRVLWCRPGTEAITQERSRELTPVAEEDELRASTRSLQTSNLTSSTQSVLIPLSSTTPRQTVKLSMDDLADVCETALFGAGQKAQEMDDEELFLPMLIYQSLLKLPVDLRSVCMSRIIFTGGASNIPGLKARLLQEVSNSLEQRGWDAVQGSSYDIVKNRSRPPRTKTYTSGPIEVSSSQTAAHAEQETDPITEQLERETRKRSHHVELGGLRAIESLGAWTGGSLLSQLKIPAVSVIDRDQWLQHGGTGSSRGGEAAAGSRQSAGAAGFKTGGAERSSWTLGLWA